MCFPLSNFISISKLPLKATSMNKDATSTQTRKMLLLVKQGVASEMLQFQVGQIHISES